MNILTLIPVLFPMIAGGILPLLPFRDNRKIRQYYVGSVVIVNALIVFLIISLGNLELSALNITDTIYLKLKVDDLSRFFMVLASLLWVLATFYTFEYIKHEGKDVRFFTFFLMTLGVIIGIGMAGNFFSLYLFYELMTLITYPLVIHSETPEAIKAGSKYLMYSFVGANLALVGFIFVSYFGSLEFIPGGSLDLAMVASNPSFRPILIAVFFMTFIGFGCKAGMWPLFAWLPTAHPVAPAPASALLSGVITKAGVMAIIRVTYYVFGLHFFLGTLPPTALICLTLFPVFMGPMLAFMDMLLT